MVDGALDSFAFNRISSKVPDGSESLRVRNTLIFLASFYWDDFYASLQTTNLNFAVLSPWRTCRPRLSKTLARAVSALGSLVSLFRGNGCEHLHAKKCADGVSQFREPESDRRTPW